MQRSEEAGGCLFNMNRKFYKFNDKSINISSKTNSQNIIADVIVLAMGMKQGKLSGMNTSRYEILKQMHLKVV